MFTPFLFLSLFVAALALPGYQLFPGKQSNLPLGGGYQVFSPNQRNQPLGGGYQLFPRKQHKLPVGGGLSPLNNWGNIRSTGGGLGIINKARDFAINQGLGTNQKNSYLPPWGISASLQKILGNKVKTQSPNSPVVGGRGNLVLDYLRRLGFNVNTQGGKNPSVGGRGFSFIDYLRQLGPKIVGKIGKLLRRRQNYEIYRKLYLAVDRSHDWVVDEGEFLYFKTNQAEVASLLPFHRKADTEGPKGHPDSLLNFYEFQAAIKSLRSALANGLYKVWFDKADKNKDGQILFDDEFEPYERARFYTNRARTSQEIYNEFRAIDLNKNGALTPDEYRVRLDNFFKHYE